jgi:hypothetical protein
MARATARSAGCDQKLDQAKRVLTTNRYDGVLWAIHYLTDIVFLLPGTDGASVPRYALRPLQSMYGICWQLDNQGA